MRDIDIRIALREKIASRHPEAATRIVEELGVCQGLARVDVAVLNGSVHGYEIKSERDTLVRLPLQASLYSQALQYVTIVVAESHLDDIVSPGIIPDWWGIWCACGSHVEFREVRGPKPNPALSSLALVQFLWRDEAIKMLADRTADGGLRSKSKAVIWDRLVSTFTTDELSDLVREQLKKRPEDWLAAPSSVLCGD